MLLGQFISYLLYDLRQASIAKRLGRFYHAVSILIDAIQELYYQNASDAEQLEVWEKRFDAIPIAVRNIFGTDNHETNWFRSNKMNQLSQSLYREIHKDVWNKLHDMGYFTFSKGGRRIIPAETMEVTDPKPTVEKFPERLPEDIV